MVYPSNQNHIEFLQKSIIYVHLRKQQRYKSDCTMRSQISALVVRCPECVILRVAHAFEDFLGLSKPFLSYHDIIIILLYCNRNRKHLSRPTRYLILNKISSQITETLLTNKISPNSIHVSRPNQYTILIRIYPPR